MPRCSWTCPGQWVPARSKGCSAGCLCTSGMGTRRRLGSDGSSSTPGGPGSKLSLALSRWGLRQAGEGCPGHPVSPCSSAAVLASPSPGTQSQPRRGGWDAAHIAVALANGTPALVWDSVSVVSYEPINNQQPVPGDPEAPSVSGLYRCALQRGASRRRGQVTLCMVMQGGCSVGPASLGPCVLGKQQRLVTYCNYLQYTVHSWHPSIFQWQVLLLGEDFILPMLHTKIRWHEHANCSVRHSAAE